MAGGKRLRPLLFLATLNALGKKIEEPEIRIACGIELIHTYSLIHDDLPAMDNDDYRRGKLTSHKKWGEAEAILAGDALLPLGIQWIAQGSNSAELVKLLRKQWVLTVWLAVNIWILILPIMKVLLGMLILSIRWNG